MRPCGTQVPRRLKPATSGAGFSLRRASARLFVLCVSALCQGADALEATFSKAATALSLGELAAAEQGFLAVLKTRPSHIGALGNLGVVYSRMGRTHDAVNIYQQALKLAPNDPPLLLNLGLAHMREENHQAANGIFTQLAARNPGDLRLQALLATTEVHLGHAGRALATLEKLPPSANVIYLIGLSYLKLGQREKARTILDESFPSAMTPAQAAFLRGKAYYDSELFDDSIREYRKARELDPSLPGISMELARALVSLRDYGEAQAELRAILKSRPADAEAAYLLGAILVQEAKEAEAIPYLETAVAARPDGWGGYYYLGRAKLQGNDAKGALPLLEKAAALNPDESAVFYQLARALKTLGRDVEARKASSRVAELKRKGITRAQDAVILR